MTDVEANLAYLQERGIWHVLSRNLPAESCPDAANKRNRLGHTGIPLSDELKSHVAVYDDGNERRIVAVHCRGHQRRDDRKLAGVLGGVADRVDADELLQQFGLRYGM